ncbi:14-3-3 protein 7-like isoform X2 [Panicum hallii]|uniref:14-3-3 protein 7-like isoform X2 n=1 Tax=Panicum hallii TaxID=206008 RepID=UPI000DF4D5E7|nr:14-3-3 protein 7-like isoform X2 [Panicum hallii]
MAAPASPSREELIYTAELSEEAQRYDDMLQAMSCVARLGTELTLLERGLFSRAYHYVIDEKCKARRILASFQLQERKKGNLKAEKAAMEFRLKVEAEIEEACYLVVNIIDKQLLPVSSSSADNLVFYHQMKGNCYRTLAKVKDAALGFRKRNRYGTFAELKNRAERLEVSEQSLKAYNLAREVATGNLCPTNPIRLALVLNVSGFFYHLLRSPERAYQIAKQALGDAESELESVGGDSKAASMHTKDFMGLLRDRLALWNSEKENGNDEGIGIGHKDAEDTTESSKADEQQSDGRVMGHEEKLKEAEQLPEISDEDDDMYRMARCTSGKNMTRTQRLIWCALDRCTTKKVPK